MNRFFHRDIPCCVFAVVLITAAGCNRSSEFPTAKVSGTVTFDGEPMPGVVITFSPKATGENPIAGPYSEAETDENGRYTLKTRYGDSGAVVASHRVVFEYAAEGAEALEEARESAMEARAQGDSTTDAQAAMAEMAKKMKSRKRIPKKYGEDSEVIFTVPQGGTESADFDLAK